MSFETERLWCFQDACASILTTLCAVGLAESVDEYVETSKEEEHPNLTLGGFMYETQFRFLIYGFIASFYAIVKFWKQTSLAVKYLEKAPWWFFVGWNVSYIFAFFVPFTSTSLINQTDQSIYLFLLNIFLLQLSSQLCVYWACKKRKATDMNAWSGWEHIYVTGTYLLYIWLATKDYFFDEFLLIYTIAMLLMDYRVWSRENKKSIKNKSKKYVGFPKTRLEFFLDGVIVISGTFLTLGLKDIEYGEDVEDWVLSNMEYYTMVVLLWWRLIWLWIENHRALTFSGGKSSEQEIQTVTGYTLIANIVHIFFVALLPFCFKSYIYFHDKASSYAIMLLFLFLEFTKLWVYWASAFGNRLSCCGMCKNCCCLFLSRKFCRSSGEYPQFVQQVGLWNYRLTASQQVAPISVQRVKYVSANKDLEQPMLSVNESTNWSISETSYVSNTILDEVNSPQTNVTIEFGTSYDSARGKAELLMLYFELAQEKIWISIFVMISYMVIIATIPLNICGDECVHDVGIWLLLIIDVYAMFTNGFRLPQKRARICTRYGSKISSNYGYIHRNLLANQ